MIRRVDSDADLARCVEIKNVVEPDAPMTLDDVRSDPRELCFLLDDRGGYAFATRSSVVGAAFTMVRVVPDARCQGVGAALLEGASEVARELGLGTMWGRVAADDEASLRFALRRGFEEVGREVALVRKLARDDGAVPEGIAELRDEDRPEAYAVYAEGVADMPVGRETQAQSYDEWCAQGHEVTLVVRDGTAIVGYAELLRRSEAQPHRLEHGMTTVLRSHRRRGLASKLKQATVAWAAARGYDELVTYTQEANDGMRAVNLRHGYVEVPSSIELSRPV